MSNILILIKNNLYISIVKKKTTFLLGLIAPVVILLVMSKILAFSSGNINIGIIDNDNSATSKALVEFIKETGVFNTVTISESDIDNKFSEKSIDGLIKFPTNFEDQLVGKSDVKLTITAKENDGVDTMLKDILASEVSNIKALANAANGDKNQYTKLLYNYSNNGEIKIEKQSLSDLKSDYLLANIFVGFVIFFMLLRGAFGAVHYFDEKSENVFNRFFMAPIKVYEYYLADLISCYIVVIIQAMMGIVGIKIVGTNMGVSSLNLFAIMCAVGLVSVSLAICIRAFCTKYGEFDMIFNFVTMVLVMVGGCFVPIDLLPKLVNNISYLIPTRWAMEAVYDLQLGYGFNKIIPHILIMILFAVVFFVIAAYKTAKADKEFVKA